MDKLNNRSKRVWVIKVIHECGSESILPTELKTEDEAKRVIRAVKASQDSLKVLLINHPHLHDNCKYKATRTTSKY